MSLLLCNICFKDKDLLQLCAHAYPCISSLYTPHVLSPFHDEGIAFLVDPDSNAGWTFYTSGRASQCWALWHYLLVYTQSCVSCFTNKVCRLIYQCMTMISYIWWGMLFTFTWQLDEEIISLRKRLDDLRKAKNTTILKREREVLEVGTPFGRRCNINQQLV